MSLHLHIERLILDGLPIAQDEASSVQSAVQSELSALFAGQGLLSSSWLSSSASRLVGQSIHLSPNSRPTTLGHQIAASVHSTICGLQNSQTPQRRHGPTSRNPKRGRR